MAVVSEALAARYWPASDALGRRLQSNGRWMTVVGVVKGHIKYSSLLQVPRPLCYVPLRQSSSTVVGVFIKSSLSVAAIAPNLEREIHALDPNLAPSELLPMQEQVDRSISAQQIAVTLLGIFGTLALILAGIGLYGVISYAVSTNTRQFGLRMALGATPSDLLRFVIARGLALTGVGIAVGAATALGTTETSRRPSIQSESARPRGIRCGGGADGDCVRDRVFPSRVACCAN